MKFKKLADTVKTKVKEYKENAPKREQEREEKIKKNRAKNLEKLEYLKQKTELQKEISKNSPPRTGLFSGIQQMSQSAQQQRRPSNMNSSRPWVETKALDFDNIFGLGSEQTHHQYRPKTKKGKKRKTNNKKNLDKEFERMIGGF